MSKHRYPTYAVILLTFIMFLSYCDQKETAVPIKQPKPVKVTTLGNPDEIIIKKYPGKVEANQDAELSFQIPGRIIEFSVQKGQDVNKGDLIAKIDPIDFTLKHAEAKSIRDERKLDLDRTSKLLKKGFAPQAEYDRIKAEHDVAQASLDLAEQNLIYTEIKAPFDGRIADTYVENYQYVQAKDKIAILHGKDQIDIAIDVPENILINIKNKKILKRVVTFDSADNQEFPVEFKNVVMQADPKTQTYRVYMTLPTPDSINILPGMTATVTFNYINNSDSTSSYSFLIPTTSIFTDERKNNFVWKLNKDDNSILAVQVELGDFKNNQIQIKSGLATGDTIITAGAHLLREGQIVKPIN